MARRGIGSCSPTGKALLPRNPELGYGEASLARIAERAGISKGVIAYHFVVVARIARYVIIGGGIVVGFLYVRHFRARL